MSEMYRTIYEPEELPPPAPPHNCRPKNYRGQHEPTYKDRAIIECIECGKFWWATVFSMGKGTYLDPREHNLVWTRLRWYHFGLRKYVR